MLLFHSFTFENAVNKLERAMEASIEVILTPFLIAFGREKNSFGDKLLL